MNVLAGDRDLLQRAVATLGELLRGCLHELLGRRRAAVRPIVT